MSKCYKEFNDMIKYEYYMYILFVEYMIFLNFRIIYDTLIFLVYSNAVQLALVTCKYFFFKSMDDPFSHMLH